MQHHSLWTSTLWVSIILALTHVFFNSRKQLGKPMLCCKPNKTPSSEMTESMDDGAILASGPSFNSIPKSIPDASSNRKPLIPVSAFCLFLQNNSPSLCANPGFISKCLLQLSDYSSEPIIAMLYYIAPLLFPQ